MWVKDQSFNKDKNFQQGEGLCDCQITIQHLQVGQDVDGSHSTGHRSEDDSQLQSRISTCWDNITKAHAMEVHKDNVVCWLNLACKEPIVQKTLRKCILSLFLCTLSYTIQKTTIRKINHLVGRK